MFVRYINVRTESCVNQLKNTKKNQVDVDKCPGTAAAYSVSAMPTFVFFRARVELDRMRGADRVQLENRVKQLSVAAPASGESSDASTIATESSTNIPGVGSEFVRSNIRYSSDVCACSRTNFNLQYFSLAIC